MSAQTASSKGPTVYQTDSLPVHSDFRLAPWLVRSGCWKQNEIIAIVTKEYRYKEGPYTESCAIEEVQEVKSSQDSDSDSATRAGELVFGWLLIGGNFVLVIEARA